MKTALIVIVTLIVASVATVLVTGTGARANYRDQFDELNRINCDADELWEEAFEVNLGSIGSYYDQIMGLGRTAIDMEVREELGAQPPARDGDHPNHHTPRARLTARVVVPRVPSGRLCLGGGSAWQTSSRALRGSRAAFAA